MSERTPESLDEGAAAEAELDAVEADPVPPGTGEVEPPRH